MKNFQLYRASANNIKAPNLCFLFLKVVICFLITLLSTIESHYTQINSNTTSLTLDQGVGVQGSTNLHFVIVALPIILSVIMSVRDDLDYGPKLVAFRFSAATVLSEAYRYRTCTGEYSDDVLANSSELDTLAARSQKLASKLIAVAATSGNFDRPSENGGAKNFSSRLSDYINAKLRSITCCSSRTKVNGGGDTSNESIPTEFEVTFSEKRFGFLNGDDYVKTRVASMKNILEQKADSSEWYFMAGKITSYIVGALGSILALYSLEVCSRFFFSRKPLLFCFVCLILSCSLRWLSL
jgi:hypothetical protein